VSSVLMLDPAALVLTDLTGSVNSIFGLSRGAGCCASTDADADKIKPASSQRRASLG